jgi:type IV pilus assembly protein PilC
LIKAGETGGFLSKILNRLVDIQEKRKAFISQLRSTLTYPIILCFAATGVIVFVLIGILPRFMIVFQGKEALLPMSTSILVWFSNLLRYYWWLCLFFLFFIGLGLKIYIKSDLGKRHIDLFMLKAPLANRLCNKIYTNQFLRTMGSLLESRVSLLDALEVSKGALSNLYYRHMIDEIVDYVQSGGHFSTKVLSNPYLLEPVKQMLVTAEESGTLSTVMLKLADYYDTEIERDLKTISSLIEPVALVLIGGVVGLIVSSVILPLFRIAHSLG